MRKLALLVVISAALLLQGCGFHLRGKVVLPEAVENVFVEGSDFDLVADFKDMLDFNGASVHDDAAGAASLMNIESEYKREVRTVDGRGIATAYTLVYRARVTVTGQDDEEIFKSDIIQQRRDFDYTADQALEKEDEEEFLMAEMRREIAQRILTQLGRR